jgi:hypothetical protein
MRKIVTTCLAVLFSGGIALATTAEEMNVYQEVSRHYEAIRLALLEDSLEGVSGHAESIEQSMTTLAADFQAGRCGVASDRAEECEELLPEISAAAQQIVKGNGLDEIRAAFFELSKPLGRYRKLTGDLDTKVMFCPMAKKAWVQPGDEIGNPYLGAEMPGCGQVIAD